jgi:CO/xanthine dehydrogenase Mo-binding subunit
MRTATSRPTEHDASRSAIGRSIPRVDGPPKVTGLTRYAGDVQLPGMLHARLVLSPHPHARIVRIDVEGARRVPGVVGVFTGRDLPVRSPDPNDRSRAPLAIDRVLFNGHPVVAVVAESEAVAEDAAERVQVEYEELPAVTDPEAAMRAGAPVVRETTGGDSDELAMHGAEQGGAKDEEALPPNVLASAAFERGDVGAGFGEAAVVVERRFRTSIVHQGYLEPRAAVASMDSLGEVTVWTSVQALFFARSQVAETLGLPEHRVRVVAMPIGGGFGGKFVLIEPLAAVLAVALRRPVSVVFSRAEEFLATTPAPQAIFDVKLGARRDGRLTALEARIVFDGGAYGGSPVGIAALLIGGYYRCPSLAIRGWDVLTHKPGSGAYRAPGAVQATFAIESALDEVAERLDMDALELRLLNAVAEGDPMPTGKPWPRIGLRECLERIRDERDRRRGGQAPEHRGGPRRAPRGMQAARAGAAPAAEGSDRAPEGAGLAAAPARPAAWRGIGVAVGGWVGGVEPSSAVCRLNKDGSLSVIVGSVDLSGTNTGFSQIAAEAFGLSTEAVQVINADSDSAPYAGASGGSKITYTVGAAVKQAAEDARHQVLAIAAAHLEAAVEDLEIADREVRVRGVPGRGVPIANIAAMSMEFGAKHAPVFGRGSVATVARAPGFAVHLAEVEVDPDSGRVRVLEQVVAQDVGRAINPAEIEGQIQGAVAQGVGWALLERMAYDEDGRLMSATLMDYALPQVDQVPHVDVILVEVPAEHGPFGAKGVGEPPVVAAAAAIANAVANAVGHRFTELPITTEAVARAARPARGEARRGPAAA